MILTNTHTPEVIDIPVTMIWTTKTIVRWSSSSKYRGESSANGEKVAQKELTNATDWKESLQVYQNSRMEKKSSIPFKKHSAEYTTTIDQAAYTITTMHPVRQASRSLRSGMMRMQTRMELSEEYWVQLYANDQKSVKK